MHNGNKVHTDLKGLDRAHANDSARQGTAEKIAPKTQADVLPEASNEPRPLTTPYTNGNTDD